MRKPLPKNVDIHMKGQPAARLNECGGDGTLGINYTHIADFLDKIVTCNVYSALSLFFLISSRGSSADSGCRYEPPHRSAHVKY